MSEEWKKEFIDTLSKKFEVDMERYEISDYILMSLFNMEQKKNKLQERIDKAIEYIDNTYNDMSYDNNGHHYYKNGADLLDILRGEDKK